MKRFIQLAFFKALIITVGFNLISMVYGLISNKPYQISLAFEVIFFLVLFLINLIEYIWGSRKNSK